jgi:hypothetical protein
MKYLKTFESMNDYSDRNLKHSRCLRFLEDMSLELSENFNVQIVSYDEIYYKGDIIVRIQKRGDSNVINPFYNIGYGAKRFNYNDIKDVLLTMISYMESERYSIREIEVSSKYVHNLIPVQLKGEELELKYRPTELVNYPIGQLVINFKA